MSRRDVYSNEMDEPNDLDDAAVEALFLGDSCAVDPRLAEFVVLCAVESCDARLPLTGRRTSA